MSDCKIYPADTVDIYGNVWPTVGENIRNSIFPNAKIGIIHVNKGIYSSENLIIENSSTTYVSFKSKTLFYFYASNVKEGTARISFSSSTENSSAITFSDSSNSVFDIIVFYN